jgi:hypothetical protein
MLEFGDIGIKEGGDIFRILDEYGSDDESNGPLIKDVWRCIKERYGEDTAWGMLADALDIAVEVAKQQREHARERFGMWDIDHKDTVHRMLEFARRIYGPMSNATARPCKEDPADE